MSAGDPNCIFCKIISGAIPCQRVYEDQRVLAFLDIGPLSPGHTLVIPKRHATTLDELSDEDAAACGRVLPKLARAIRSVTGIADCNILQNNGKLAHQAVGHVHFHIIPRSNTQGLEIRWPAGKLQDGEQLTASVIAALKAGG